MDKFNLRKFIIENRVKPVKEMASTGKLVQNQDFQFLITQAENLIKDTNTLQQVKKLLVTAGEIGLDLGYGESLGDQEVKTKYFKE